VIELLVHKVYLFCSHDYCCTVHTTVLHRQHSNMPLDTDLPGSPQVLKSPSLRRRQPRTQLEHSSSVFREPFTL